MSGPILYDFGGLVTAPGLLARNPASCIQADNWLFPAPGIMRKRIGFRRGSFSTGGTEMFRRLLSKPTLLRQMYGISIGAAAARSLWLFDPDGAGAAVADSDAVGQPGEARADLASIGALDYLTGGSSLTPLLRTGSTLGGYRAAGMPSGLSPLTYSMNAAVHTVLVGAPGTLLPDGSNVAYRVTWHKIENTFTLGGAPTGRLVIRNIAGTSGYAAAVTKNVALRIPLPYRQDSTTLRVDTTYFWRLWRSRVSATDTADDQMYQVAEAFVTAGDIAAGYASFTDQTPDVFILGQARLHTNSTDFPEAGLANGLTFADDAPPKGARGIANFANCLWLPAGVERGQLNLQLLSTGFAAGNTITVISYVNSLPSITTVLTAVAGAPAAAGDFTIVGGLATLSLNIEATARNIVDAFNRTTGVAECQAFYVSLGTQAPGNIIFRVHGTAAYLSVQSATAGALFQPNVTALTSGVPSFENRNLLRFSKEGRGDSWPVCNTLTVGPAGSVILAVQEFRERLLCFTTEGLYEVTGTDYSNFTTALVDSTVRLIQRFSIAAVEDAVYALTRQGVVEITGGSAADSEGVRGGDRRGAGGTRDKRRWIQRGVGGGEDAVGDPLIVEFELRHVGAGHFAAVAHFDVESGRALGAVELDALRARGV